jgi:hypothetical protein
MTDQPSLRAHFLAQCRAEIEEAKKRRADAERPEFETDAEEAK